MFQALRYIHIVKIHLLAFVFKPKARAALWRWWELCPWVQAQANCDRASENNLHPPCHLCPWHRWSLQNLSTHHLILLVNKKTHHHDIWYLISEKGVWVKFPCCERYVEFVTALRQVEACWLSNFNSSLLRVLVKPSKDTINCPGKAMKTSHFNHVLW